MAKTLGIIGLFALALFASGCATGAQISGGAAPPKANVKISQEVYVGKGVVKEQEILVRGRPDKTCTDDDHLPVTFVVYNGQRGISYSLGELYTYYMKLDPKGHFFLNVDRFDHTYRLSGDIGPTRSALQATIEIMATDLHCVIEIKADRVKKKKE